MNRLLDNQYAMRILKGLTTEYKNMPAYHLGIIDEHGNVLRKMYQLKSEAERNAYTYLDRLIITLKKMIDKQAKRGDVEIAKLLSPALWLVREHLESDSRKISGIEEQYQTLFDANVTLAEEELAIKKFFAEEGEGGAPTNSTAGVAGTGDDGPVVHKKDINKFRKMARRSMPGLKDFLSKNQPKGV